jgi:titin
VLSLTVDTTPPSAPQNVAVVSTTGSSITLGWTASNDNRAVWSYDIYRNGIKDGTKLASGGTSYVDSALAAHTTYTYYVKARDAAGNASSASQTVSGTTGVVPAPVVPSQGRLVRAVPGDGRATVRWAVPLSDGGSPITGYVVITYVGLNAVSRHDFNSAATTQVISGLSNGKTYAFKVAATNAVGRGQASARSAGITVGAPTAPTNASATAGRARATVRWGLPTSDNGSALTGFVVTPHHDGTTYAAAQFGAGTTSGVVGGLVAGWSYTFTVVATNGRGPGPPSAPSAPTVPT